VRGPGEALYARTRDRAGRADGGRSGGRTTWRCFPLLYWPITEGQATPSDAAYAKLNDFLRFGGMILFDTQDGQLGGGEGTEHAERDGCCSASRCGSTCRRWSRRRWTTC
jgi:hypothetical protein